MTRSPLVDLQGVGVTFASPAGGPATEVLRDLDLQVEPGTSLAVVGASGSGKSTLLNVIAGLLPPTTGRVIVAGIDLVTASATELAALRNRELGFVFQQHHLLPQCSALENVLVPTLALSDPAARRAAVGRGRALLEEVGLGDRMAHRPAQLSGGECQRVAVVRALINEPSLVLADEPTGSLDARNADQLADLLCALNTARGVALVLATHSERLAARMARRLELCAGHLVEPAGA